MAKKTSEQPPVRGETIFQRNMEQVMHESMLPYAEHVILERALPRVEDGLKPVQRRILYTMLELSLTPDKPHRKSARIVGDCLGKYHPHGDSSVYDAMVRMAQGFNMRAPLCDGHGNFGSVDGDCAAAMRYTEARMTPLAMELLRDIQKDTVPFRYNFDDTLQEPDLLPGRFPNLLVNGASGIAVGLATNIPPHNLGETIDATVAMIDDPDISLSALMQYIPAPDFPTGGYLIWSDEVQKTYETGRGKLIMRAKTHFEEQKNGKTFIVITEIPYQVNKAAMLEKILAVTQEKKLLFAGISDIRDESDRSGMRAVIEVKKDADPEKLLNYLYKYSDLQCTFGANIVAIAGGKPMQMGLIEILRHYIAHQKNVVTRRTKYELETAKKREHILAGLMVVVNNMDAVVALIRRSKSPKEAKTGLMETFKLSEIQAQAILDLRLQRLTNLEVLAIEQEYKNTVALIKKLEAILASEKKLMALIKSELLEIREKYADPRRTEIIRAEATITVAEEDLKVVEDVTVILCEGLKVRRIPTRSYNPDAPMEDIPLHRFDMQTNQRLRLFTQLGNCFTLAVEDIPETRQTGRAANLAALLSFEEGEKIVTAMPENNEGLLFFITAQGMVKCTEAAQYATKNKRIAAIPLKEGDTLLSVVTPKEETMLIVSERGMSIRFRLDTVP
ncbi:MAG: DNA topoisomerase 4 subunit A, partial [Eubacteriales bacterium]|nr:DNA topoisomerase 4 subunit A [Eubacteriales bacterium]